MAGVAKFDKWYSSSGVLRPIIINAYSVTTTTQDAIAQGGSGENRGSAWFDPTGFNLTVTPVTTSSRFLIMGHMNVASSATNNYNVHYRMLRNSTEIGSGQRGTGGTGGNAGNTYSWAAMGQIRQWSTASTDFFSFQYVDSPATTSSLTYKIQVLQTNYAATIYINRSSETTWQSGVSSTLTVLELQS